MLVFGEILPKSIALQKNTYFARKVAPLVYRFTTILKPIRDPLTRLTNWISRFFFVFLKKEDPISFDELRHVLHTSEKSGVLLPQECDLIEGALDLQESTVRERMRPRSEMLYYDIQDPLSHLIHLFVDMETTRVPICDGNLETVLGVLSVRQFFLHAKEDLLSLVKKPYFVPETMKAWALLKNLRERGESIALVIDEYGSISGLITQEDLIEAVVGEITDRRDETSLYTISNKNEMIASGKLEISSFNDLFSANLFSKENVMTLGGWLIEQIGDIPPAGFKYETPQFLFHVLSAEPHRIRRIYVRRLK